MPLTAADGMHASCHIYPALQRPDAGEKEGLQRGMLGGWYSDPAEQQGLKKTASVRVDTALGPEYHVQQPVAVPMQVQQQAPRPGVQTPAVQMLGPEHHFEPMAAVSVNFAV